MTANNKQTLTDLTRPYKKLSIIVCSCLVAFYIIFLASNTSPKDRDAVHYNGYSAQSLPVAPRDYLKTVKLKIDKFQKAKLTEKNSISKTRRGQKRETMNKKKTTTSRFRGENAKLISKEGVKKEYGSNPDKIAKIVHLTWKTRLLPAWTREWLTKWQITNPDWKIWFWSDQAADKFIRKMFPSHYSIYEGYKQDIQRADSMRYFILYEFGGFYADLDIEPLKSLETLRNEHVCAVSTEPQVHARFCIKETNLISLLGNRLACNAVMACRRRHPFFKYVIDTLILNRDDQGPLLSTGPVMLTKKLVAYDFFMKNVIAPSQYRDLEHRNEVYIAPDTLFMPSYDPMQNSNLKSKCNNRVELDGEQLKLCDMIGRPDFRNEPRDDSLTNHHWIHTWIRGTSHNRDPSTISISDIIPNVVFPEEMLNFNE